MQARGRKTVEADRGRIWPVDTARDREGAAGTALEAARDRAEPPVPGGAAANEEADVEATADPAEDLGRISQRPEDQTV